MKNMKKWVSSGLLLLAVLVALTACGGTNTAGGTSTPAGGSEQGAEAEKEKIVIGFSQGTMNHPYRVAMVERNIEYAKENYPDVEVVATDGQNQASKQVSDVESLISRQVDVLIISPLTSDALTPVVKKAMDAGIPVVTLDRKVNTDVTLHIGGDNLIMGRTAGEYITEALGGKGNVIEIQGTAGASATVERNQGFRETLGKDITVVAEQHADYLREPALKFVEDMLQRYGKGEIQAIYAHNDEMALGAVQALKAAGRLDEVKVFGMDGMNLAIDAIKNGELLATLTYPYLAPEGIQYAYKIAKGETVEKEIVVESVLIDASNAEEYTGKGI